MSRRHNFHADVVAELEIENTLPASVPQSVFCNDWEKACARPTCNSVRSWELCVQVCPCERASHFKLSSTSTNKKCRILWKASVSAANKECRAGNQNIENTLEESEPNYSAMNSPGLRQSRQMQALCCSQSQKTRLKINVTWSINSSRYIKLQKA